MSEPTVSFRRREGWDWHCYECGAGLFGYDSEDLAIEEAAMHAMVCESQPFTPEDIAEEELRVRDYDGWAST